jgi:hypothetical protein
MRPRLLAGFSPVIAGRAIRTEVTRFVCVRLLLDGAALAMTECSVQPGNPAAKAVISACDASTPISR